MIRTRVRTGELLQVRQGIYLSSTAWPQDAISQHVIRAHAEQAANPDAVVSHQSAAVIWGLPAPGFERWAEQRVAVTLPSDGHGSRTRAAVHHVGPLPAAQIDRDSEGYRVTSAARTAVDLAADLALPEALVVLDGAARLICASLVAKPRRRDYSNPRLVGHARQLFVDAADSIRIARLASAIALTHPGRESAPESLTAGHIERCGMTHPEYQAEIRTHQGVFFPDCLWRDRRLIGECDGAVKYADRDAFVAEKTREQILRDLGYGFVRWQAKEIMIRPMAVMERIARALG